MCCEAFVLFGTSCESRCSVILEGRGALRAYLHLGWVYIRRLLVSSSLSITHPQMSIPSHPAPTEASADASRPPVDNTPEVRSKGKVDTRPVDGGKVPQAYSVEGHDAQPVDGGEKTDDVCGELDVC